ncbi:hypothetical protein OGAPHI_002376 [Ogataea philodendri]|uniref:Transcription factor domain-containing protein n=1 Tax=Ogataea philodendri TaxID=1378263 RepID=A0A9P8PC83_9ASCO|nr:uncharacterized protein OGAPHI_002376 [Ogataea philodendri]KAH3668622.1 hypothetical protein OGAPHI_002376 [Ogataea philodendri]
MYMDSARHSGHAFPPLEPQLTPTSSSTPASIKPDHSDPLGPSTSESSAPMKLSPSPHQFEAALGTSANNLAQSLNNLLETKIDETGHLHENLVEPAMDHMFDQANLYDQPISYDNLLSSEKLPDFITRPVVPDSFNLQGNHKKYLNYFYHDFARVILPLPPSPRYNPAREILLAYGKNHNYLLSAILACGAMQSHRKTKDPQDEKSYCSYLSICLRLLSTILADEAKVNKSVEPMLLTVMLLTSYTAISLLQKWRPHLRAAKDLLSTYAPFSEDPRYSRHNSYVIAFCRNWYMSIENIAGLTAPSGGVLKDDRELELVMYDLPYMKKYWESMLLCREDGFNYVYGYSNTLGVALQKLIKSIKTFKTMKKPRTLSIFTLYDLVSDFRKEEQFEIISKTGIVPKNHFMHPENDLRPPPGFEALSPEAIQKIEYQDGSYDYISWYDICHQSYVIAAYILITSNLGGYPKRHPSVQELVQKAFSLFPFLRAKGMIEYQALIIQVSMYFVGLNCVYKADRDLVARFFENLRQLHSAAASFTLERLKCKWDKYDELHKDDREIIHDDNDFDDDDLDDVMNY